MSHAAIAAALALGDVSPGERLAAFSLASFANREHRAFPGTPVAAARAGLSRSQYLAARDALTRRGSLAVEESGGGRGNSPVVALTCARTGPWLEHEINAPLFDAVLSYSRTRGSARLLLATLAAVADEDLVVDSLTTDELRAAAGMADSTYRRARATLLTSGELVLEAAGGGRSRKNRWVVRDPRAGGARPAMGSRRRVAPRPTARPLLATVPVEAVELSSRAAGEQEKGPGLNGASAKNPVQSQTVSPQNPAQSRTVSTGNPAQSRTVSPANPAQNRTVSAKTPPETPPETPPPNARAGREPQNPQTHPPSPPEGGSPADSILVEQTHVTKRGRKRRQLVQVDLAAIRRGLGRPTSDDQADWEQIRGRLADSVGQSTFDIWLDSLELIAVDTDTTLVIAAPADTTSWLSTRFGHLIGRCAQHAGRQLRLADEPEQVALGHRPRQGEQLLDINQKEVS